MSKIITPAALQGRSLWQLQALYREAQQELIRSQPGSVVRGEALASLELISRAIAQHHITGPGL